MSRYPASLRRALYDLALEQNIVAPHGAYPRPAMRVAPFYEPYGVQFVWDLPYSTIAVARVGGRVDLCRGFVENMLDFAFTDGPDAGMIPRSVAADGSQAGQDGTQAPLLTWLTRELHRLEPDEAFVGRVYPALAAFIDWWQSPRRDYDGDGLCEYAGSTPTYVAYESGHDYSPERDLVMGEPTPQSDDGLVHEPFADVFLNSCLYVELDALADLARVADPERVGEWEGRRDALAARMREAMWDDEIGGFFPVVRRDLCPSQPRHYRHTPALLQPLWAGLATPEEAARTVDTLLSRPRNYPHWSRCMSVRLGAELYNGYQVVTDGLHPSRGDGAAAGGVELTNDGFVARFGEDRGPAAAAFWRLGFAVSVSGLVSADARVVVEVEDGDGRVFRAVDIKPDAAGEFEVAAGPDPWSVPGGRTWVHGLRRIELVASGCTVRSVDVRYDDWPASGLLSPYGIKSAHPLDGKHPAPGAPTQFWSGTIWGPHQMHGCYGLARYGFTDLAAACARAFCDATATSYAAGGDAFEHLSHEDGRGLGTTRYTWGAAAALLLMADFIDPEDP
ncbi:MAG TPA: trehalase family glycosidase [Acidimicrobiales bacterium]|nr:trehalase family glycosidase [Acidimicrobiales bacterium]